MSFDRLISEVKIASVDLIDSKQKYSGSIDKAISAIDMAGKLFASIKSGDKKAVEDTLSEWKDVNETLAAISIMEEEIEESKKEELAFLKGVVDTTGKVIKVASVVAGLAL